MYYKFKEGIQFKLTPEGGILRSADRAEEMCVDEECALFLKHLVGCTAKDGAIALSVAMELGEPDDSDSYLKTIAIMNEFIEAGFVERDRAAEERNSN